MPILAPSEEQVERAVASLRPFVVGWKLPLNPDDLHELAYVVLAAGLGDASVEEIEQFSRERVTIIAAEMERLRVASGAAQGPGDDSSAG